MMKQDSSQKKHELQKRSQALRPAELHVSSDIQSVNRHPNSHPKAKPSINQRFGDRQRQNRIIERQEFRVLNLREGIEQFRYPNLKNP